MATKAPQSSPDQTNISKRIKIWQMLIAAQSLLTSLWLLLIPKEAGNAFLLGYSLRRLVLLIPLVFPLFLVLVSEKIMAKRGGWSACLTVPDKKSKSAVLLVIGGFLLAITVWSFVFLYHFMRFFPDLGAYIRLLPMAVCYFLLGVEAVLSVPLILFPPSRAGKAAGAQFPFKSFFAILLIFIIGMVIVAITGWGIDPVRVSIISLGAPILEGQIWYISGILVLVMAASFAWAGIPSKDRPRLAGRIDLMVALSLWVIAVVLWMSLPLPGNNYFAPPVQAPNFEKYPFSDAAQYDQNGLFVYYGTLENRIISKPLYVTLLALLHALVGLSYERVILLQTIIVAFFPVVLYFIGKELHSRLGGIAIALFAIMREMTGILASSIANVSSTKLLLSDIFAALLASLLTLVTIRWLKNKGRGTSAQIFIIGGLIGMFILVRIQTLAFVPFMVVLIFFRYLKDLRKVLLPLFILLLSVSLVITPVLLRNHSISGVYWIDNPSSSAPLSRILTQGLESQGQTDLLKSGSDVVEQNKNILVQLLTKNFGFFLNFTLDNFARNEISSILVMPVRLGNKVPFIDYLQLSGPFFSEVYSQPNLANLFLFLLNFSLIAAGFAFTLKKNLWPVLAVVGIHLVYCLSSSMSRLSGWRFILPVDWVFYAFYALGLIEGLKWVFRKITGWELATRAEILAGYPANQNETHHAWPSYVLFGILFFLAGAAIPLREAWLPPLAPAFTPSEACRTIETQINQSENSILAEDFYDFCISDKARVYYGFGIYPRFFKPGEGFYNRSYDPWFGKQPYSRLVFSVIGARGGKVYIQSDNASVYFPNGALVYAVGVDKPKFEAVVVSIEGKQLELVISPEIRSGRATFSELE